MSQPHKICPTCHSPAEIQAPQCLACGHGFRTQFAPVDQTRLGFSGRAPSRVWLRVALVVVAFVIPLVGVIIGLTRAFSPDPLKRGGAGYCFAAAVAGSAVWAVLTLGGVGR